MMTEDPEATESEDEPEAPPTPAPDMLRLEPAPPPPALDALSFEPEAPPPPAPDALPFEPEAPPPPAPDALSFDESFMTTAREITEFAFTKGKWVEYQEKPDSPWYACFVHNPLTTPLCTVRLKYIKHGGYTVDVCVARNVRVATALPLTCLRAQCKRSGHLAA